MKYFTNKCSWAALFLAAHCKFITVNSSIFSFSFTWLGMQNIYCFSIQAFFFPRPSQVLQICTKRLPKSSFLFRIADGFDQNAYIFCWRGRSMTKFEFRNIWQMHYLIWTSNVELFKYLLSLYSSMWTILMQERSKSKTKTLTANYIDPMVFIVWNKIQIYGCFLMQLSCIPFYHLAVAFDSQMYHALVNSILRESIHYGFIRFSNYFLFRVNIDVSCILINFQELCYQMIYMKISTERKEKKEAHWPHTKWWWLCALSTRPYSISCKCYQCLSRCAYIYPLCVITTAPNRPVKQSASERANHR